MKSVAYGTFENAFWKDRGAELCDGSPLSLVSGTARSGTAILLGGFEKFLNLTGLPPGNYAFDWLVDDVYVC